MTTSLALLLALGGSAGAATVSGRVTFDGTPPAMPELGAGTDPVCPTHEPARWVTVTGGAVADVVVRIAVGSFGGATVPSARPHLIDQKACRYQPRVTAALALETILVRNSDATMHNIHGHVGEASDRNEAQPAGAKDRLFELPPAGDVPYRLTCDVHPWMDAFVVVTDHPYYTVTGPDGTFKLIGVPAGSYTLEAWHPNLGKKTIRITVGTKDRTVEARLPAYGPADYKVIP